jgi:hypothetical protein
MGWLKRALRKTGRKVICKKIHTYHSRFIPEGVAKASQIFLRDAHVISTIFGKE